MTDKNKRLLAYTRTYGCRANVSDGEKINGILAEMGYGFTGGPENADLILLNTCAVRENAETRAFGNIGALVHFKRVNPDLIIAVCGCMVQQGHIAEKLRATFPFVDLIFGTGAVHKLPELLTEVISEKKRVTDITACSGGIVEGLPVKRGSALKADIPVMFGCDNFCSYCVVPYVRGRERSRLPADIIKEARELINGGVKEIALLGQNVNSYGKEHGATFAGLLREAEKINGDFRVTYMTSHPKDLSPELIDAVAESGKISRHLHLPVQSGSDRILSLMNRGYSAKQYEDIISFAREKIPGLSVTTDIIVGFPGETRADFEETLSLIRKIGFDSAYTFIYSKREGTKAVRLPDPVTAAEKSARFRELLGVLEETGGKAYGRYIGKTLRVLCEGEGRTGKRGYTGKSGEGVIVDFDSPADVTGEFVNVRIEEALKWALLGKAQTIRE
ncbi:MAG: tRNA (N6-isopentenyl adenosine(37)-C2)-methylthiotransferase MiaB [Oscillospiraceae bacterium]|jgi:tRNA-2-methylthio-N6-dimethylallyladenosine synthase|nr:tRNA (N6-isopentenyl adenosine(37)-C2)-methylthiotransferase MiaB [Oscillospiraceae bacterium]